MIIRGLEYVVFAFLRDMVGKERHQAWLEFSAPLTLDMEHKGKLMKEMFADMDVGSVFGMYNIILARIAEAESQIHKLLSLDASADTGLGASSEVDVKLRDELIAEILRQVILADDEGRQITEICSSGWQGIEGLDEISRKVLADEDVDLSYEAMVSVWEYMIEVLTGRSSSDPNLVIDPQVDVDIREQAQVEALGHCREGYEGGAVEDILNVVYIRLGIAVNGERIPPRTVRQEFSLLDEGQPYDEESPPVRRASREGYREYRKRT